MLFNSLEFLIFFPIVLLIYYVIPKKIKYIWLLVASYYFYMCWNAEYALLILTSTVITYISGLLLEHVKCSNVGDDSRKRKMRFIVAGSFVINLGILCYFKYTNFFLRIISIMMSYVGISFKIPSFDIVLPVGISFYTFQALSYTVDVYRGDIYAEKNFFRYALFVSFFPQLVAGPIERSKNLLTQLAVPHKTDFEKMRDGFLMMLWGYFLKIVLADRIAVFVDTVYGDTTQYPGCYLVIASILFAIQIYCDFAGYSTIAMGAAQILGIKLLENFNAPYLSMSVGDFWRRWHISLTSWFKDYLYIPLGGSRKGIFRKYLNKMIVFLVSGLWHGASFTYVIWGGLNGVYQIVGEIIEPIRTKICNALLLNRKSITHKIMRIMVTFIFVDFAWIFFRAQSVGHAFEIINSIFTVLNPWVLFDGSLYSCGLDIKNYWLMMAGIGVLLFSDICKDKGICLKTKIQVQAWWFRAFFISIAIAIILLFGIWGPTYNANNFIYFQF